MRRKALIGVSTGEGSPQRVDTAQNTARAAAGGFKDRRLHGALRPPTRHHGKAHRTTLLAILHQPKEGGGSTLLLGLGWGSCTAPLKGRDWGGGMGKWGWAEKGLCTRRHWETLTRLWPLEGRRGWARLGSGHHRKEMAPGKMKEQRLGEFRGPVEKL